jgi:hypothetical protein
LERDWCLRLLFDFEGIPVSAAPLPPLFSFSSSCAFLASVLLGFSLNSPFFSIFFVPFVCVLDGSAGDASDAAAVAEGRESGGECERVKGEESG